MCGESNLPCYMHSVVLALLSCADFFVQVVCTLYWKNNSFILLHSCWFRFDLAFINYLIFPCTFLLCYSPTTFFMLFPSVYWVWWAEWFYTNQNPFSPKKYPMVFVVVVCLFVFTSCDSYLFRISFSVSLCIFLHCFILFIYEIWKKIFVFWMTDLSMFVVSI